MATTDETTWAAPSLEDVAAFIPTRTRNGQTGAIERNGDGERTFNASTNPTDIDVTNEIAVAQGIIATDVGSEFCPEAEGHDFEDKATGLTALYAAMLVELGHFPEQVAQDRSGYTNLKTLYDDRRERLRSEIEEVCGDVPGTDGGEEGGAAPVPSPAYDFYKPVDNVGFRTSW